jgi:hypothetical protein
MNVATHCHMVAIMGLSALMLKCGNVDFIGPPCMRTPSLSFDDRQLLEAQEHQCKACDAFDNQPPG